MNQRTTVFAALLLVAVAAMASVVSTAGATVATSNGVAYTGNFKAVNENGHMTFHYSNGATFDCSLRFEGKLESHGASLTAESKLTSVAFTNCTNGATIHTNKNGALKIHDVGNGAGTMTWTGAEWSMTTNSIFGTFTCVFTTNATDFGVITGSNTTGGKATLDISVNVERTGGSSLCGSSATMTGALAFETPENLSFDPSSPPPTGPGTTITSNGSPYTGTLTAANDNGHLSLHGSNGVTIECSSFIEGKIESHGPGTTAEGAVGALSFTGCTNGTVVHVKKGGSLIAHAIAGTSNATVTSTGTEIHATAATIFGTILCVYATNATHIGTLTGSSTTGGNPTLDLSASIPRTGGSSLCGSTGTLTGSYLVTTPSNLNIDVAS